MYQIQVETFIRLVLVLEVFIQRGSALRNCPACTPTVRVSSGAHQKKKKPLLLKLVDIRLSGLLRAVMSIFMVDVISSEN